MKERSLIDHLHEVQSGKKDNYISKEEALKISKSSGVSLAEIFGVTTFYTMFSVKPRGRHIIRVCKSLSCHMEDSGSIINKISEILGVDVGETTQDKEFTLEESSCLGMCSVAPAMMIDDIPFGNVKIEEIPNILEDIRRGKR